MLIDNKFELGIPTHIYFILYKFDHIDSMIISRVIKECKNWNTDTDESLFTVDVESFKASLKGNKRLNKEKTTLVYFLLFITPIFFLYFKILSENYIIIFFLVIYIAIISKFKK